MHNNRIFRLCLLVLTCAAVWTICSNAAAQTPAQGDWTEMCRIKPLHQSRMENGGWNLDAYPDLKPLNAKTTITVADIKGPAVITCLHTIRHRINDSKLSETERKALEARGIIIEIYYNGSSTPAVRVPLADFFADGCGGQCGYYGSLFVEKAPQSYNCFIPMPFEKSAKVCLVNETDYNLMDYTFVEYETLPDWDATLGYFYATWKRFAFQLNKDTDIDFFQVSGSGHLIGRAWSVCTDEPFYNDFSFVMEGNNEVYIDGEAKQRLDYLGSEDSFTFSWGFNSIYAGPYSGMNFLLKEKNKLHQLSIYRFLGSNKIRFADSLRWKVNWSKEQYYLNQQPFSQRIEEINKNGGAWIDYATTFYWYQKEPDGYRHAPMLPLNERCQPVLKKNPK
ncbi:MAG: DUF2961 domain-containing protein [Planctomycetaceae bacterium]|jgi:hypothetical protein|nr:DUF2961 domain-containing protein [Planctomycetaceae bacterium]